MHGEPSRQPKLLFSHPVAKHHFKMGGLATLYGASSGILLLAQKNDLIGDILLAGSFAIFFLGAFLLFRTISALTGNTLFFKTVTDDGFTLIKTKSFGILGRLSVFYGTGSCLFSKTNDDGILWVCHESEFAHSGFIQNLLKQGWSIHEVSKFAVSHEKGHAICMREKYRFDQIQEESFCDVFSVFESFQKCEITRRLLELSNARSIHPSGTQHKIDQFLLKVARLHNNTPYGGDICLTAKNIVERFSVVALTRQRTSRKIFQTTP